MPIADAIAPMTTIWMIGCLRTFMSCREHPHNSPARDPKGQARRTANRDCSRRTRRLLARAALGRVGGVRIDVAALAHARAVGRRDRAEVAAERLRELRRLAVADAARDLAHRQRAVREQAGGALHAHAREVLAEGRVRRSRHRRAAAGGASWRPGARCRRARDPTRTRLRRSGWPPCRAACGGGRFRVVACAPDTYGRGLVPLAQESCNLAHSRALAYRRRRPRLSVPCVAAGSTAMLEAIVASKREADDAGARGDERRPR